MRASSRDFARHGYGLWAVRQKETGEAIGFCGLRSSESEAPELLYGLWPRWWGQGLATEAAQGVIAYAFSVLRLAAVEGATDVPNLASVRVMERLGMSFTRRGTLNGLDTAFYRLARETFEARQAADATIFRAAESLTESPACSQCSPSTPGDADQAAWRSACSSP